MGFSKHEFIFVSSGEVQRKHKIPEISTQKLMIPGQVTSFYPRREPMHFL